MQNQIAAAKDPSNSLKLSVDLRIVLRVMPQRADTVSHGASNASSLAFLTRVEEWSATLSALRSEIEPTTLALVAARVNEEKRRGNTAKKYG
jgi:hypothetical protein